MEEKGGHEPVAQGGNAALRYRPVVVQADLLAGRVTRRVIGDGATEALGIHTRPIETAGTSLPFGEHIAGALNPLQAGCQTPTVSHPMAKGILIAANQSEFGLGVWDPLGVWVSGTPFPPRLTRRRPTHTTSPGWLASAGIVLRCLHRRMRAERSLRISAGLASYTAAVTPYL
jgi:hypothetical protein